MIVDPVKSTVTFIISCLVDLHVEAAPFLRNATNRYVRGLRSKPPRCRKPVDLPSGLALAPGVTVFDEDIVTALCM